MGHTSNYRTNDSDATTVTATSTGLGARRVGVRRVSLEQEKADFAAWLREYRRWTQTGCCAPTRSGEIEWGGDESGSSH